MTELLLKIVDEERYDEFFKIDPQHIADTKTYNFIKKFVDAHGEFPPIAEVLKKLKDKVDYSAPFEYYWDEYEFTRIRNSFADLDTAKLNYHLTEGDPRKAVEMLRKLLDSTSAETSVEKVLTFEDISREYLNFVSKRLEKPYNAIPTGWTTFDMSVGGLSSGGLHLIVGRAKTGKTVALLQIMKHVHTNGRSVMLISMEMTILEMAKRIMALYSSMNSEPIRKGEISTYSKRMLEILAEESKNLAPAYFIEGSFALSLSSLRRYIQRYSPEAVFIDGGYLIKIAGAGNKKLWEVARELADGLKTIAMSEKVPIIASFQLNREASGRKQIGLEHIHLTDALAANCTWAIAIVDVPDDTTRKIVRTLGTREGIPVDFIIHYDWERMNFKELGGLPSNYI